MDSQFARGIAANIRQIVEFTVKLELLKAGHIQHYE